STSKPLQEDDGKRQTDFVVDDDNWSD
ncbi:Os01g0857925, partial [Oryza sativa Japonica Group]